MRTNNNNKHYIRQTDFKAFIKLHLFIAFLNLRISGLDAIVRTQKKVDRKETNGEIVLFWHICLERFSSKLIFK